MTRLRLPGMLHPSILLFGGVIAWAALAPAGFTAAIEGLVGGFLGAFDWLVLLVSSLLLLLCLYLATSRFGRIRLGSEGSRPRYSNLSWWAMLFTAGMGSGLVFWGVAEPVVHYAEPPPGSVPGSAEQRMLQSLVTAYLHWGLHAWAIYASAALSIAYFGFRRGMPLLPSAAVGALLPPRYHRAVSGLVDSIAVSAVVFGLVATLGMGSWQLMSGLHLLYGEIGMQQLQTVLLCLLSLCFIASAMTPLQHGIRCLSLLNIVLASLLLAFLLLSGPTGRLMNGLAGSVFAYLSQLATLSLPASHDNEWTQDWTATYLLWWMAWAPFVGIFIARISEGRSIRELILGVLLLPTLFTMLWFSILGGAGLNQAMNGDSVFLASVMEDYGGAIYALLDLYPYGQVTGALAWILMFTFIVTSADSGSYVLGMFSSARRQPSHAYRGFWGVTVALLAIFCVRLLDTPQAGATSDFLAWMRALAIVGAIPFMLILLLQCLALIRMLRSEADIDNLAHNQ